MMNIALFGAGGKMGMRVARSLKGDGDCSVACVEPSEVAQKAVKELGYEIHSADSAAADADVVILAVPDKFIGKIAAEIVPIVKPGAMVVTLDPAAPYAGRLPQRNDIVYFVVHPSHPPLFDLMGVDDPEARRDYWGGGKAPQCLVCALMQGDEEDYAKGEKLFRKIFRPIMRAHRISVEQMAYLEPAMTESVALACISVIREGMDEVIRRGVPAEAAKDFMLGHLLISIAIQFDAIDWEISEGAKRALTDARTKLFKPDWKKLFDVDELMASVKRITEP